MKITLDDGAHIPTKAHKADAGYDLYSRDDKTLYVMSDATFDTGVHIELPPGTFAKIEGRSGLNINCGVVSCGGVIDRGYTGSIVVKLYNLSNVPYRVKAGDKIAQLIILPCLSPDFEVVETLESTDRGGNGFGSSGR